MSTYLLLRGIRIVLLGAFLVALALATTFKAWNSSHADDSFVANVFRYAPMTMLALALIVGFAERVVRMRNNFPVKRFGQV